MHVPGAAVTVPARKETARSKDTQRGPLRRGVKSEIAGTGNRKSNEEERTHGD